MASNPSQKPLDFATDYSHHDPPEHTPKRRRLSWRSQMPLQSTSTAQTAPDPHTALLLGHHHEGLSSRARQNTVPDQDDAAKKSASRKLDKMIAPYLAQHIPQQYNPLGDQEDVRPNANTKFCYRHRPDMLCRKQADEPTMEMLQEELGKESQADQQSIANVWSLFSAAPARQRNLMLQGILSACCFPQLSFISSNVRNLIKIDFLSALPTELGFKILCHLDTTSLCKAGQVSRRWRQLADDDVVWHRMCEQHIDRKCTKCGWGLPLLDQRRLRTEKRRIQLRASGRGLNEWSPDITPMPESQSSDISDASIGSKRSAPGPSPPEDPSKRLCTKSPDQQMAYFDQPKKRPWKDVYKDRFKVGTNWKYGRYSTQILKGHTNGVMCLQFNDEVLITGSYDTTIKVWDLATGKELRTITGHNAGIRCLQFDDNKLVSGDREGVIIVWNWRTGQRKYAIKSHEHIPGSGVIGLHFVGNILASASTDHTIVIHNLTNRSKSVLTGHEEWVNCVKLDIPSRTLLSASDDMKVKLWDLDSKTCIRTYEGHVGQVQQVLPLPHDFEIDEADFEDANNDTSDTASTSSSGTPYPDLANDEPFFPNDPDRPPPPTYFITAALDGTIRLWHAPSGRTIHSFFGHIEGIWSLAVDSLRLVSGAEDKMIKIWDPRTGKNERTLTGHTGPVNCVGLSDSMLVSGSEDGTVRVHCFVGDA
ncbi:sulfur metabolite repression control protein-like protein SconB [Massarina eburnea CBS 473.64]|uniref:Sulfur metabolite repression control protein-like protein SconB n=1 Tax=Massarina eburnea CBS 473.64 TaxID=1395130 RepID=A0A6A6RGQ4_9PLEO|nr:sulfur metabolite repression control protein-like protein SconB [Massarina eburnea CBS 473.64]